MCVFNGSRLMNKVAVMNKTELLAYWIDERESMRHRREDGFNPPWSQDDIMNYTRFCNVCREDDKVTKWVRKHYLNPAQMRGGDQATIFASAVARFINWPDTLECIDVQDWHAGNALHTLQKLFATGQKVWGGAYVISTNGLKMSKDEYVVGQLEKFYKYVGYGHVKTSSLEECCKTLMRFNGIGSFMAGQIIADCKNTEGHSLRDAPDWWTWCCPGPGSIKGLNYYFDRLSVMAMSPKEFDKQIKVAYAEVYPHIDMELHMQDFQNCLCEFSKYCRIKYGHGRAKNRYNPREAVHP